jgi:hypothetical protein
MPLRILALTKPSTSLSASSSLHDSCQLEFSFVCSLVQVQVLSDYSATPPMAAPGSRATATGLALTLIAVGAGVNTDGGFALLLSFAGVLAGASLIFLGVRMANDDPTASTGRPEVLAAGLRCLRRNLALVGLLLASSAVSATAADREAAPVLCFCAFLLLLLGIFLFNVGVLLLGEQELEH